MTSRHVSSRGDLAGPPEQVTTSESAYAVLWRQAGAPRLMVTSIAARLPMSMNALGLLLLLRDRAGLGQAALAVSTFTLGFAVASPLLGRLADRRGPRVVLLPTGIAHPLGLLLVVLVSGSPNTPLVLVVAALAGAATPPAGPCSRALWPGVARAPGALATAYAADAVSTEVVWILGPLLLGLLVAVASPSVAIVVAAGLSLLGTLLLAAHPAARAARGTGVPARRGGGVLRLPLLRALIGAELALTVGLGLVLVAIPAYAPEGATAGVLVAVWGLGSAAFGLLAGRVAWQGGTRALVAVYAGGALLLVPLAVAGSAPVVVVGLLLVLAGAPLAPINLATFRLVAEAVPAHLSTSAFAWLTTVTTVGMSAGSALAGLLLPDGPAQPADLAHLYGAAALCTLVGAVVLLAEVRGGSPAGVGSSAAGWTRHRLRGPAPRSRRADARPAASGPAGTR